MNHPDQVTRILLVEDEAAIRESLKLNLELEDYEVVTAEDGKDALKRYDSERFDLIVLDVMLPEIDGFAVCEKIRLSDTETPILFLTAKDSGDDRVTGLKLGAEDYITKPFHLEELLIRIRKLIDVQKKLQDNKPQLDVYTFGPNEVNFSTYTAKGLQGEFKLTKKETLMLKLLIERKDQPVSREQILQNVWGYDVYPTTRTIDNFILAYRKYFEEDPKNPKYFHSVRGVGYKFTA